jgi:hypothetical protein
MIFGAVVQSHARVCRARYTFDRGAVIIQAISTREVEMALQVGDTVEQQARSTEQPGRIGVIEEVLRGDPSPRYRIRWNDGRESVYTPAAGSLHKVAAASEAH